MIDEKKYKNKLQKIFFKINRALIYLSIYKYIYKRNNLQEKKNTFLYVTLYIYTLYII